MQNPGRLVTIARYFHPTNAHIAAGKLESEGIPVNLLGINHASVNWLMSNALGGIRLQVPAGFAARAVELINDIERPDQGAAEHCPFCGSADTTARSNRWKISLLAVHLLSLPLPWGRSRRQCESCGQSWESEPDG